MRQVDSPLEDSAFVAMLVGQCGGAVDLRRCVLKLFQPSVGSRESAGESEPVRHSIIAGNAKRIHGLL